MGIEYSRVLAGYWMDAFNAHDLEQLLSLYGDNAVHYSPKLREKQPETQGRVQGKDALRVWWAGAFERLPKLRYELERLTIEGDRVFMEYVRKTPGELDLFVAEVLHIQNGLIVESRVYHG